MTLACETSRGPNAGPKWGARPVKAGKLVCQPYCAALNIAYPTYSLLTCLLVGSMLHYILQGSPGYANTLTQERSIQTKCCRHGHKELNLTFQYVVRACVHALRLSHPLILPECRNQWLIPLNTMLFGPMIIVECCSYTIQSLEIQQDSMDTDQIPAILAIQSP